MKRLIAILLAAMVLLGMCACGANATVPATTPAQTMQNTQPPTTQPTTPPTTVPPTEPQVIVTVMLDSNGGSCERNYVEVLEGDCYGSMPTAYLPGYVFLGWFTDAEAGEQITEETQLLSAQTHTLYAHWQVQTEFTVVLNANGGRISAYNDHLIVTQDKTYGTLPTPIREGYVFKGWFTAPEKGTQIKNSTKFTGSEDVTLYAHWEYNAYDYWSFILENRVQQIPQCRRVVVYLERVASRKTYIKNSFLTDAGAINPSLGLTENKVTDEWINEQQPYIIIKLTYSMSDAMLDKMAMLKRFADAEIYIFPTAAIDGKQESQLYYRLQLAKLLYPEYFEDVDLATVKKELGISPKIYY